MLKQVGIVLLLLALGATQSNLELSEIETNPIPTVVNFDGFANTEEQPIMESNVDFVGSVESPQQQNTLINDPNNFFLDNLNQNIDMNAEANLQDQSLENRNQNIEMNTEGNYQEQSVIDSNQNIDMNAEGNYQDQSLDNSNQNIEMNAEGNYQDQSLYNSNQNIDMNAEGNYQNQDMSIDNVNQNIDMNAEGNYQNQDMSLNTIETPQTQNWSQTDINIQENSQDCIIIYSQCHYKGESQQLCQSTKNIDNFDHDIKSIYVPKGYVVRLYNKEDYTGEKIVMRESQECLTKPLSLMQLYGRQTANFMILAQNANLRAI